MYFFVTHTEQEVLQNCQKTQPVLHRDVNHGSTSRVIAHLFATSKMNYDIHKLCHTWVMSHMSNITQESCHTWVMSHMAHATHMTQPVLYSHIPCCASSKSNSTYESCHTWVMSHMSHVTHEIWHTRVMSHMSRVYHTFHVTHGSWHVHIVRHNQHLTIVWRRARHKCVAAHTQPKQHTHDTQTHIHTYTLTHTHIHMHIHTCSRTRSLSHAHTHTHAHTTCVPSRAATCIRHVSRHESCQIQEPCHCHKACFSRESTQCRILRVESNKRKHYSLLLQFFLCRIFDKRGSTSTQKASIF